MRTFPSLGDKYGDKFECMYKRHISIGEIADKFNISRSTVRRELTKRDVVITKQKWNTSKQKRAVSLYKHGLSQAKVAAIIGVTQPLVSLRLRNVITARPKTSFGAKNTFYRRGSKAVGAAHKGVSRAIRDGILKPKPCEVCGKFPFFKNGRRGTEAHHEDYAKPLMVRWLCKQHHFEVHRRKHDA